MKKVTITGMLGSDVPAGTITTMWGCTWPSGGRGHGHGGAIALGYDDGPDVMNVNVWSGHAACLLHLPEAMDDEMFQRKREKRRMKAKAGR